MNQISDVIECTTCEGAGHVKFGNHETLVACETCAGEGHMLAPRMLQRAVPLLGAPKWTRAPWFVFSDGLCVGGPAGTLGSESGAEVAGIAACGMKMRTVEEAKANAQLIKASPLLYVALERLLVALADGRVPIYDDTCAGAHALAAARGEA